MPESNARFVAIWAAAMVVISGAAQLVEPLGIAEWNVAQAGLVASEVSTFSAVVLAGFAFFWTRSVKEPAALQGSISAFALSSVMLGAGFGWWQLDDQATQLLVAWIGSIVILVLVILNRMVAYAPETVTIEVAKAQTPSAVFGAVAPRLVPPPDVSTVSAPVVEG